MTGKKYNGRDSATIAAIRDYDCMLAITENTPEVIKCNYERLSMTGNACFDGMPKADNPRALESKWADGLDKLEKLHARYRKAAAFVMWFEPMWLALSELERDLLKTYEGYRARYGAMTGLSAKYSYSERQLNRLRGEALTRFSVLLHGRCDEPMSESCPIDVH